MNNFEFCTCTRPGSTKDMEVYIFFEGDSDCIVFCPSSIDNYLDIFTDEYDEVLKSTGLLTDFKQTNDERNNIFNSIFKDGMEIVIHGTKR